jgi:hypothetical protein
VRARSASERLLYALKHKRFDDAGQILGADWVRVDEHFLQTAGDMVRSVKMSPHNTKSDSIIGKCFFISVHNVKVVTARYCLFRSETKLSSEVGPPDLDKRRKLTKGSLCHWSIGVDTQKSIEDHRHKEPAVSGRCTSPLQRIGPRHI